MLSPMTLLPLTLVIPLASALLIACLNRLPALRDIAMVGASLLLFAVVIRLLADTGGIDAGIRLATVLPGLPIRLAIEPLGMLFATVASGLWILNAIYSIGYMRANNEKHQTRFHACFAIAIASTMGIAFAADLFTLFIFYEALSLSTYPLVAHKQTPEALAGARTYLTILLASSIALLLPAIIWTWTLTGSLTFTPGGLLDGAIHGWSAAILLALYAFGIGKAALMPVHRWLPAAMVAPTPVSALLHAVAVVKAGVFTMLKVGVYIFGPNLLLSSGLSPWLAWIAAASILIASVVALRKTDIKARLAYSTVSQLSYVTLGMALAVPAAISAAGLQIAMHAMGKITLFMCAGAIYTAARKTDIRELNGLAKAMPFTFAAFFVAALSIIGLPPLGGSWVKWMLILAAADAGQLALIIVIIASSLLNVAYLIPPVVQATFSAGDNDGIREAPVLCVIPLCLTAAGCVGLFFFAGSLIRFLAPATLP